MGGFFLARSNQEGSEEILVAEGCQVFEKKGMKLRHRVDRAQWQLYLYDKIVYPEENLVEINENDFIACTGTLIYRNAIGVAALKKLYDDFRAGVDVDRYLLGNYCVILFSGGKLIVFNDRNGYYRTYQDTEQSVISSSFLAVRESLPKTTVSPHELYEYVFYGYFLGRETLFKEIQILNCNFFWTLHPQQERTDRSTMFIEPSSWNNFDECVAEVRTNLLDYFQLLGGLFDNFACGLSGGFDSRLTVAVLRKLKIPTYIYVYGGDRSPDVVIAKAIANGEHFALDHVNRSQWAKPDLASWPEEVARQYYFFDGAKATGLFDNGADYTTRITRCEKSRVQINGSGGEMYRELDNISKPRITVDQFLRNIYHVGYFGFCSDRFDLSTFFEILGSKVRKVVGITGNEISCVKLQMLAQLFRGYFAAGNLVVNNQLSPALLPYAEPRLVYQGFAIPVSYKFHGSFQAALIRSIDPAIARYPSAYGWNFFDNAPMKKRLERMIAIKTPIWLRVLNRRRRHINYDRPQLLQGDYFTSVFKNRQLAINEFLNPSKIGDPGILTRAFTAELLIGNHGNR